MAANPALPAPAGLFVRDRQGRRAHPGHGGLGWPRPKVSPQPALPARAAASIGLWPGLCSPQKAGVAQSSSAITKPLRILGENQVDFGGIMRRWRQTSINCPIVTGGSVTAKAYSPVSTSWRR